MRERHTLRVGLTAIVCAAVFRLFASGVPAVWVEKLRNTNFLDFMVYLETGRDVRFSPSLGAFSPDFVESPPAATTEPTLPYYGEAPLPQIYNAAGKEVPLEELLGQELDWSLMEEAPTVLILHTHATESYTKNGEVYEESSQYRTLDEEYNLLSLGAYVVKGLGEVGISAIQDRTLHDYPSYNGSYTRARKTIRQYLEEYPSIQLVLDLHRDAVEVSYGQLHTRAEVDGAVAAQLMVVLGTNYDTWQENLSLGLKLHAQLERQVSGMTRPLQLRSQRFNQDLCPGALLVEIGAAGNTHEEALLAAEQLVQAIAALAQGTRPPEGQPEN